MSNPRLSHSAALILKAISLGYCFGFDVMEATGLPSGTVYPALRRLERDELVESKWEPEEEASASSSGCLWGSRRSAIWRSYTHRRRTIWL
jgi:PadR family transcriptional regulator PadR